MTPGTVRAVVLSMLVVAAIPGAATIASGEPPRFGGERVQGNRLGAGGQRDPGGMRAHPRAGSFAPRDVRSFGPAGPPPVGAAGPPPVAAAGSPPVGAAGPPPVGAAGAPPLDATAGMPHDPVRCPPIPSCDGHECDPADVPPCDDDPSFVE